ncbi:zinc finger protein 518A isoform X2 [Genypterus blacodes]
MEEDLVTPKDASYNANISVIENEKEKVKEFVYKHFKEVTDGSIFCNTEESSIKELGSPIKNEKATIRKAHCKIQQGAVFSGKILSFGCSVCRDDVTYSPNDLLKHFKAVHQGTLPTYPCDLCGFVTNEFPALQRHRIEHRSTQVTCEICNDNVQYSLLWLTRHYITCHSQNGQFHCERCKFTTQDAGTFVQHIHHHKETSLKCFKCRHISLNHEEYQKHMKAHSGGFPFTCQICGFGALRRDYLKKHMIAVHEETERSEFKAVEDNSALADPSESFKLKNSPSIGGESQEAPRMSKLNSPGKLPNKNGRLNILDMSLEEIQQNIDGTAGKNDNRIWSKCSLSKEQPVPLMLQENDNSSISNSVGHTNPNGLTVLMVKNKISLPANCTTKVMGFKMVDGKKHLVLKVIPTGKEVSSTSPSVEDLSSSASKHSENGEGSYIKSTRSHHFPVSERSGSHIQADQDIMAVKIKTEEEETSISNAYATLETHGAEETELTINKLGAYEDALLPDTNLCDEVEEQSRLKTTYSQNSKFGRNVGSAAYHNYGATSCDPKTSNSPAAVDHNWVVEQISAADLMADIEKNKENDTPEYLVEDEPQLCKNSPKNSKMLLTNVVSLAESSSATSSMSETSTHSTNCTQNSPNQEVFTFHNYSKESFGLSPDTNKCFDNMSEISTAKESVCGPESLQFSLTLAESPEPLRESGGENMAKMSSSDIQVDECIATDEYPLTEDENPESVLQDFNIIKVEEEEENIPIPKQPPETNGSSSLGSFVEEHSDEIISQQLNKERAVSLSESSDCLRPTKTKLQILQLAEGKQQVFFKTTENGYTVPVHLKDGPGFKLIANSTSPQINVSYMKPGFEKSRNTFAVVPSPNHRMCLSAQKAGLCEKGTALLSPVQPGVGTTSNHYLINSAGLKGPVLLSSSFNCNPGDKSAKTHPTCYLLQRPVGQAPSAPGIRLANSQLPLNSCPVLTMPGNSPDKPNNLQPGRQAFLLRYVSPPKSGLLLNNLEGKVVTQCSQTNESIANKVIFKIVSPSNGLIAGATSTSGNQPLFLATKPQAQCFLVSSNKADASASSGVRKLITIQNNVQKYVMESSMLPSLPNVLSQGEKPVLAPRPIRPPSQRKRRRNPLFDELPVSGHKARRLASKAPTEKETTELWQPVAKEVERTLKLAPFSSLQEVKCPRRYQPVVVLNHPDADIPEVTNIMMTVNRYRGAVSKVSLSEKTIQALSEFSAQGKSMNQHLTESDEPRPRPLQSLTRERFLLRLKLRKKSKKKYEVVEHLSSRTQDSLVFVCWFCGRLFNSQEDWIGHGQRHLMEATKDWNKLF